MLDVTKNVTEYRLAGRIPPSRLVLLEEKEGFLVVHSAKVHARGMYDCQTRRIDYYACCSLDTPLPLGLKLDCHVEWHGIWIETCSSSSVACNSPVPDGQP